MRREDAAKAFPSSDTSCRRRALLPDFERGGQRLLHVFFAYAASMIDHLGRVAGRAPVRELVEAHSFAAAELGRRNTSAVYLGAVSALQRFSRTVAGFFSDYAIWLTPTLTEPPLLLGALDTDPRRSWSRFFQAGASFPHLAGDLQPRR